MGCPTSQTCKRCGRIMRFEFGVADDVWNLLPEQWNKKALCIECFLELLDDIAVVNRLGELELSGRIWPIAVVGYAVSAKFKQGKAGGPSD